MRLRNIPGARETIAQSRWVVQNPEEQKGSWRHLFADRLENQKKVGGLLYLEIGTGKGRFITQAAQENPETCYIGIEKYSSVLIRALEKQDEMELPNLLFIRADAENILNFFGPGEIDRIYLNFSDPWPKERHAKRRLPSREFLRRYNEILSPKGTVEFKTDNRNLFDFAVEEVKPGGFQIDAITYDLHHDPVLSEGNIITEYEERFSAMDHPICKYILSRSTSSGEKSES